MKKISTTLLLVAFLTSFSFSQNSNNSSRTTEEEYNYMSKGYQVQINDGLDMKKGYSTGKQIIIIEDNYIFKFIPLTKNAYKENILVGYIVNISFKNAFLTKDYWCCLPLGNKKLLDQTYNSIYKLDNQMIFNFFKAYAEFNLIPRVEF